MTDYHIQTTAAGDEGGSTWANAMDFADYQALLTTPTIAAGDRCFIKGGVTYTVTAGINCATDGTNASAIATVGVLAATTNEGDSIVLTDHATGDDRPIISCGANSFTVDNYYTFFNIRFTATSANGLRVDAGVIYNCEVYNTGGTGALEALYLGGSGIKVVKCDIYSTAGNAVYLDGPNHLFLYCYIHDSTTAVASRQWGGLFLFSVIDDCTTGLDLSNEGGHIVVNNTFHDCTGDCIDGTTCPGSIIINNIFDDHGGYGIDLTRASMEMIIDWNNYHTGNGGSDVNNVTVGPNKTANDPLFTAETADDFSLGSGSGCIDACEGIIDEAIGG